MGFRSKYEDEMNNYEEDSDEEEYEEDSDEEYIFTKG